MRKSSEGSARRRSAWIAGSLVIALGVVSTHPAMAAYVYREVGDD